MTRDPALSLVIAAIGARISGEAVLLPAGAIDWPAVGHRLERHRIEALAAAPLRATRALPAALDQQLRDAELATVVASQRAIAASARIAAAFARAGIDLLFVKGATLAALAWPPNTPRMSLDIDLLVAPTDVGGAAATLAALGATPLVPADPARIERWHRVHKESQWRLADGQLVDLHSRLADDARMIPTLGLASPRQPVAVGGGVVLDTLADEQLFAYLCVHGQSSGWFRLKWIADVAALLAGRSGNEICRLHDRAVALGAGRTPAVALTLVRNLFGVALEPLLAARLAQDRAAPWLVRLAHNLIDDPREPTAHRLGTLPIRVGQMLAMRGPRFALGNAARQLRDMAVRG